MTPIKWNEIKGCWEQCDPADADALGSWDRVWGWTPAAGQNPFAGEEA